MQADGPANAGPAVSQSGCWSGGPPPFRPLQVERDAMSPAPGSIFPNSITRVVPASGWPSDWLALANQRRKTQCGCRGLGSVMCSYCQSHTEDVVA